jgi:hypothetical protein
MSGAQLFRIAAGQTVTGLEFTMAFAQGFSVSGFVFDAARRPVAGVALRMMQSPASQTIPGLPESQGAGLTRPDGSFTIGGIVSGTYQLFALVPVSTAANVVSGGGAVGGLRGGVVGGFSGGIVGSSSSSSSFRPSSPVAVTVAGADVSGVTLILPNPAGPQ